MVATKPTIIDYKFQFRSNEEIEERDRKKTGRVRCIGCGKFVAKRRKWNQCSDCDTRDIENAY
jgi:hypothetical protein